jgi:hypothetical protein
MKIVIQFSAADFVSLTDDQLTLNIPDVVYEKDVVYIAEVSNDIKKKDLYVNTTTGKFILKKKNNLEIKNSEIKEESN